MDKTFNQRSTIIDIVWWSSNIDDIDDEWCEFRLTLLKLPLLMKMKILMGSSRWKLDNSYLYTSLWESLCELPHRECDCWTELMMQNSVPSKIHTPPYGSRYVDFHTGSVTVELSWWSRRLFQVKPIHLLMGVIIWTSTQGIWLLNWADKIEGCSKWNPYTSLL